MNISIVVICKDDPALATTLTALQQVEGDDEVIVVDASEGRLAGTAAGHPWVNWIDYAGDNHGGISIPHQRNIGVSAAKNDVIVFVDAGCLPRQDWLSELVRPLTADGEMISCGAAVSPRNDIYGGFIRHGGGEYLSECPTINLAVHRKVYDEVGLFDETFQYGSDVDFSWRAVDRGFRIRYVPQAVIEHDWGGVRRQLKRSYRYGRARSRLYAKHPHRLTSAWKQDPILLLYPTWLVGLPVGFAFPPYYALPIATLVRARHSHPLLTLADHLIFGIGALRELPALLGRARS